MIRLTSQSDSSVATYYIVQHMPDVMRKELRNVGILVEKGQERTAKFVGERADGQIDGRSLKAFADARLYKMWVRHWKKALHNEDWKQSIFDQSRMTYQFTLGGEVENTSYDSVEEICSYLFSLLVSDGGIAEALSEQQDAQEAALSADVRGAFRRLDIIGSVLPEWCRHPVREQWDVKGASSNYHRLSFYQESRTEAWAIEPISLGPKRRQYARERAGYLAFLFDDLRNANPNGKKVNPAALVRVNDEHREADHIKYALDVIQEHAMIVDWSDENQQQQFLKEREFIARAA